MAKILLFVKNPFYDKLTKRSPGGGHAILKNKVFKITVLSPKYVFGKIRKITKNRDPHGVPPPYSTSSDNAPRCLTAVANFLQLPPSRVVHIAAGIRQPTSHARQTYSRGARLHTASARLHIHTSERGGYPKGLTRWDRISGAWGEKRGGVDPRAATDKVFPHQTATPAFPPWPN